MGLNLNGDNKGIIHKHHFVCKNFMFIEFY